MRDLKDYSYLEMAYSLAERGRGWTSPNPCVGSVCVRKGLIIGYGYHKKPGNPHAEIEALERAGSQARGSDLYVTLEPCLHWGRTPPCVDAILRARPKKVVISSYDPNPIVYRKGVKKLRDMRIEISVGLLEERNQKLNETYSKYITHKMPFVTLKAALSLDGRIATKTSDSRWISSPETREYIHLLRGEYDALMVGINTVLQDDPRLTVRHHLWKGKKIQRVVLDSQLRFPLNARILSTLGLGGIAVFTTRKTSQKKKEVLDKKGVEVIELARPPLNLKEILRRLGEREVSSVLVEGGSRLITSFLEENLADKLILTISPRLFGGERAPSFFEGKGIRLVKEALELKRTTTFFIGEDLILEGYF